MGRELPTAPNKPYPIKPLSVHPLHSQAFVEYLQSPGQGGYFNNRSRRTGRSTAIALSLIAEAIRNPGKPVQLYDHFHGRSGLEHMVLMVQEVIGKLGLREMRIFKDQKGTHLMLGREACA